jgi:hypothetical protein
MDYPLVIMPHEAAHVQRAAAWSGARLFRRFTLSRPQPRIGGRPMIRASER